MSGNAPKKEPHPTLSFRVEPQLYSDFYAAVKQMRRSPTDALEELVRAFVEYTKDGRLPHFPLYVSAESYRDKEGKTVPVGAPVNEALDKAERLSAQLDRLDAYMREIGRILSQRVVARASSAARAKVPPFEDPLQGLPRTHQSPHTEPDSRAPEPPPGGAQENTEERKRRRRGT